MYALNRGLLSTIGNVDARPHFDVGNRPRVSQDESSPGNHEAWNETAGIDLLILCTVSTPLSIT